MYDKNRWKQRDIHEKREARKLKLAKLHSELSLNQVLRPRIQSVISGLSEKGIAHFRAIQRRLKEAPSPDKPDTGAANQPTYDMMLSQLLEDVFRDAAWLADGNGARVEKGRVVKEGKAVDEKTGLPSWATGEVPESKVQPMQGTLEARLEFHFQELLRRDAEVRKEIELEEKEQNKYITSEDLHEAWDKTSVVKAKESPLEDKKPKRKEKEKVETIEVLNPGVPSVSKVESYIQRSVFRLQLATDSQASSSKAPVPAGAGDDTEEDDDDVEFGPLTPALRAFASIPIGSYEKSYAFIQKDSSVLTEHAHDSLLAEAFEAERRGDKPLAQRCVHQSLLVNYCRKLGRDGVGLFFQRSVLLSSCWYFALTQLD
jgi:cell division cycle protein 37